MLSDRERHMLAQIEAGLRASDRRFADGFEGAPPTAPRHRWAARAVLGFGILLVVVGAATGAGMLVFQGLLFLAGGVGWLRWQAARDVRAAAGAGPRPRSGARRDGPSTGRGQPV